MRGVFQKVVRRKRTVCVRQSKDLDPLCTSTEYTGWTKRQHSVCMWWVCHGQTPCRLESTRRDPVLVHTISTVWEAMVFLTLEEDGGEDGSKSDVSSGKKFTKREE